MAQLEAATRGQAAAAWREGFTLLQLNEGNPPAWLRICAFL